MKTIKTEVFDISDEEWETKFKNYKQYDYRDNHDYVQYKMYELDIIYCMKCKAHSFIDRVVFKSCSEKEMHTALE